MKMLLVGLPLVVGTGCLMMVYQPDIHKDAPTIAVVLGYHFFLTENISPQNYASNIAAFLNEFSDLRCVVISGANTRPGDSTLSEARVLQAELERFGVGAPIVLEETARTTFENLRNTARMIAELDHLVPLKTRIVLFSDSFQRPKVWWHSKVFFPNRSMSLVGIPLWRERLQWQRGIR